jgi:hypothetical protein
MSHFYGVLHGSRGEATRCGTKDSGVTATAASWEGAIKTTLYERDGQDYAEVTMQPWHGSGTRYLLYRGPVGEYKPEGE